MKFVLLLLFSPFVACSFSSICPQQPNNVVVNCNNANPFNPFPGGVIPGRGRTLNSGRSTPAVRSKVEYQLRRLGSSEESSGIRVLDIGYNKPPPGSKLEFQQQRSDSSEESSESVESSEELSDHFMDAHRRPLYPSEFINSPSIPSNRPTATVDHKLDFSRRVPVGVLKTLTKDYVSGHPTSATSKLDSDETHGHGHSGQYNHNADNSGHGHHHEHSNKHSHEHSNEHNHGHEHGHNHEHHHGHHQGHMQLPNHLVVPSLITRPIDAISGAHIIPQYVVPSTSGIADIVASNLGLPNFDRGVPRVDSSSAQGAAIQTISVPTTRQYPQALDLVHDTHDRLILSQRGFRAHTGKDTYELYPQELINDRIFTVSLPTVVEEGMNTEITCEPIPFVSTNPQTVDQAILDGDMSAQSHHEMLREGSSTLITTDTVASQANLPQTLGESTVTKVTTTTVEERPVSSNIMIPANGSGSTVTKVTTTKVEGTPSIDTSESVVSKVTSTQTNVRPIATDVSMPSETVVFEKPVESGSTVTKVTTTTVEKRPMTINVVEETVDGGPTQIGTNSGAFLTKVTTTKTEGRPIETVFSIPEETIVGETSSQTGSTVTKVTTTTTTGNRPSSTMVQEIPEVVGGEMGLKSETFVQIPEVGDASGLRTLVRPVRDGTYRYDSLRQRSIPLVYRV